MIGMDAVAVVARKHHAAAKHFSVIQFQRSADLLQGICQKHGACALLGLGADLLIVKDGKDRDVFCICQQKCL